MTSIRHLPVKHNHRNSPLPRQLSGKLRNTAILNVILILRWMGNISYTIVNDLLVTPASLPSHYRFWGSLIKSTSSHWTISVHLVLICWFIAMVASRHRTESASIQFWNELEIHIFQKINNPRRIEIVND